MDIVTSEINWSSLTKFNLLVLTDENRLAFVNLIRLKIMEDYNE
jgi:hypothetical protein